MAVRRLFLRIARYLVLVGILVFVSMFLAYSLVPLDFASDHEEDFGKIETGMTEEEVQTIFGVPPGGYLTRATTVFGKIPKPSGLKIWVFDDGTAEVMFDKEGKVVAKSWSKNLNRPRPFEKIFNSFS